MFAESEFDAYEECLADLLRQQVAGKEEETEEEKVEETELVFA